MKNVLWNVLLVCVIYRSSDEIGDHLCFKPKEKQNICLSSWELYIPLVVLVFFISFYFPFFSFFSFFWLGFFGKKFQFLNFKWLMMNLESPITNAQDKDSTRDNLFIWLILFSFQVLSINLLWTNIQLGFITRISRGITKEVRKIFSTCISQRIWCLRVFT